MSEAMTNDQDRECWNARAKAERKQLPIDERPRRRARKAYCDGDARDPTKLSIDEKRAVDAAWRRGYEIEGRPRPANLKLQPSSTSN